MIGFALLLTATAVEAHSGAAARVHLGRGIAAARVHAGRGIARAAPRIDVVMRALPADVKGLVEEIRVATQDALSARLSRMDVEVPLGTLPSMLCIHRSCRLCLHPLHTAHTEYIPLLLG
jgi:hypothetical protein